MAQYPAAIDLAVLDGSNGFRIDGIDDEDRSGRSVASAGDVNGDGYDDIIVGADGAPAGYSRAGAAYVVFGSGAGFAASLDLAALNGSNGFRIEGSDPGDLSGRSVASAGDVNGDGYDDMIVGAHGAEPNGDSYAGRSYVVFGSGAGFAASLDLAGLDGSNGFRIDGIDVGDNSGSCVAAAGDVNGDGFDDVIVGAYAADPNGDGLAGESYVVFGSGAGFAAAFNPVRLNGSNGFRIDGIDPDDRSGFAVASAGDFNGDGFDDIIVGAFYADPDRDRNAGESYVVFGSGAGFTARLDLAALNGNNGFRIDGIDAFDQSGRSVASAGDVNGDGYDDVVIGAFAADADGDSNAGESYVVFGSGAGFAASLDLAGLNGSNGFRIDGIDVAHRSGLSVSSAGDVNGDGFDDIIVGAAGADPGGDYSAGESYVVFGSGAGFAASLDLAALDGDNGFRIDGIDPDDRSGFVVASAGDVNGDGLDDLIVGAYTADPDGDPNAGESYVIFGRKPGEAVVRIGSAIGQTIHGGDFGDRLLGLGGADRLIGHGGRDALRGGSGRDRLEGGAGDDVYILDDALDTIVEARGGGYDIVRSLVDFTLAAQVEQGQLLGRARSAIGNGGANRLIGSAFDDAMQGRGGQDSLLGEDGADRLVGGDDIDRLRGGDGADALDGGDQSDFLFGDSGNDRLIGGAGLDRLTGGVGRDRLAGGLGSDLFVFADGDSSGDARSADVITDFRVDGNDRIDLRAIDTDRATRENEDFAFLGVGAFTGAGGELRYDVSDGDLLLQGDIDGDKVADLTLLLQNVAALTDDQILG